MLAVGFVKYPGNHVMSVWDLLQLATNAWTNLYEMYVGKANEQRNMA